MKKYLILFVFLIVGIRAYSVPSFQGSLFSVNTPNSEFDLSTNDITGAQMTVYADFNNDKLTDIAVLSDDQKTLSIYVWSTTTSTFTYQTKVTSSSAILGAQVGDFNYDGLVDLLIITQQVDSSALYSLYLQQSGVTYCKASTPQSTLAVPTFQHPLIFDKEGDRYLDLLVYANNTRTVYSYDINSQNWASTPFLNYVQTTGGCSDPSTVINTAFKTPNSNAFVDLNGDCAADLFFESTTGANSNFIEIWYRVGIQFCLVDTEQVTLNTSIMSFGDFDGNGGIDVIYADTPSGANLNINIHVLFNMNKGSTSNPCGLISNPAALPYKNRWNIQNTNDAFSASWTLPAIQGSNNQLYSPDPINRPARFRVGDINIDGLQDVLVPLGQSTGSYGVPILLINTFGNPQVFTYSQGSSTLGTYYTVNEPTSTQQLVDIPVLYASFFDFDELGNLGIWLQQPASGNSGSSIMAVFNFVSSVSSENFFLKSNVLNGYAPAGAPDIYPSLGGVYYGPSVECVVTTVVGSPKLAKGAQLAQSGYNPIDLIYIYIGLGRTNNYVEDFSVGVTAAYQNNPDIYPQQSSWTPIIPNSQLIVNPTLNNAWSLDVYVSPTKETVVVAIVTVLILIFLGILIIIYHKREKDEDKKNQDRILHIFG